MRFIGQASEAASDGDQNQYGRGSSGWPDDVGIEPTMGQAKSDLATLAPHLVSIDLPDGTPGRRVTLIRHALIEVEEELNLVNTESSSMEPTRGGTGPRIQIDVIGSVASVHAAEASVLAAMLAGAALAALGSAVAVWLSVKRGLRPLGHLAADLAAMSGKAPEPIDDELESTVELLPIVTALNGFVARVQSAMEREQRFTDAAAHELRTPIAELRMLAEVAERFPDPERLQRGVRESGAIAGEMNGLVTALLHAARGLPLDSSEAESVSLIACARESLERHRLKLDQRWIKVSLNGDTDLGFAAPRAITRSITRNLIDNAAAYTPDNGHLNIHVSIEEDGSLALCVDNGPVELSVDDLEPMFEPFWRADASRSQRSRHGLGLSIVRTLCEASGLSVQAERRGSDLRIHVAGQPMVVRTTAPLPVLPDLGKKTLGPTISSRQNEP